MTASLQTVADLVGLMVPSGSEIFQDNERLPGIHTAILASQILAQIQSAESTHEKDFGAYLGLRSLIMSGNLDCEVADRITELARDLVTKKNVRNLFVKTLQKQANQHGHQIKTGPAVVTPEPMPFPTGTERNTAFGDLDKAMGLGDLSEEEQELLDKTKADGTLGGIEEALKLINKYSKELEGEEGDTVVVPDKADEDTPNAKLNKPGLVIPFKDDREGLREALQQVFTNVRELSGSYLNQNFIDDRLDAAVHRCVQFAYGFTGNIPSNMKGYIEELNNFAESENDHETDLYQRLTEICNHVIDHDLESFGLKPTYPTLRLSQIIPNYFLKKQGYLMDASSCSSGKTGNILMAPVETGSKVTVVLVENNTYETILGEFRTWYSTRQDFKIIGKEDFWPTPAFDWTELEESVVIILDKAFVSRIDDKKIQANGGETFQELIQRSDLDLVIADEVHNYKGKDQGGGMDTITQEQAEEGGHEQEVHSNCSRCLHVMSVNAKYRLFSSATPLLNDLQEPARLLTMMFPATATGDRNYHHQADLKEVRDSPSCTDDILEKTAVVYTPLQANMTRVAKPDVDYDVEVISNEGKSIINGKLRQNKNSWIKSWTKEMVALKEAQHDEWLAEDKDANWSDQKQDEIHFDLYLTLMEEQIAQSLKDGKQICFYTNNAMQTHGDIKSRVLKIAKKHKIGLREDEVVIANGSTSDTLRKPVSIKGFGGVKKPVLVEKVWDQSCKVLIANSVIEVGLDGLQGTDRIDACGRISVVFLLANPYTDAARYQLFSRFVRTQGADSSKLPDVKFYQPMLYWDSSLEGEKANKYARNEQTNKRIMLKKLRSDLLLDGIFPEGVDLSELKREIPQMVFRQLQDGTYTTDEGQEELEDKAAELLNL